MDVRRNTVFQRKSFTIFPGALANRPLVSFIPGHSRTVAGYTRVGLAGFGLAQFRGLLVYDPAPPGVGTITRWENFDAQSYRRTFTAHVTLV